MHGLMYGSRRAGSLGTAMEALDTTPRATPRFSSSTWST
jgi:hypothetical protein